MQSMSVETPMARVLQSCLCPVSRWDALPNYLTLYHGSVPWARPNSWVITHELSESRPPRFSAVPGKVSPLCTPSRGSQDQPLTKSRRSLQDVGNHQRISGDWACCGSASLPGTSDAADPRWPKGDCSNQSPPHRQGATRPVDVHTALRRRASDRAWGSHMSTTALSLPAATSALAPAGGRRQPSLFMSSESASTWGLSWSYAIESRAEPHRPPCTNHAPSLDWVRSS
jgi:hypothetical protein